MRTTVIHIRDIRPEDVYIGRGGKGHNGYFGNPYTLEKDTPIARADCIRAFKRYFLKRVEEDPEYRRRILELKGKRLVCFCNPKPCHGDVIADWLNK